MPPHSIGSGTLSFGLVSIPVKMFSAASSGGVSFNLLHEKCGGRIKQQQICPACNEVLERSSLVKGYEFAKDQYVRFTDEELKGLEGEASQMIDIAEFVPLDQVDPIYFEKTYYLGPDKGGAKAYRLLCDAMVKTGRVALAKYVMRGKENLVLIRSSQDGLMLHTMYFADEVRDFGEIDKGADAAVKPGELNLALRLIEDLSTAEFKPEQYNDEYRGRVLSVVEEKVAGKEITAIAPQVQRTQVIDLMDALKQSLEGRASKAGQPGKKKPAVQSKSTEAPAAKEKKRASR
ncbi:MAG TPA: Ku protein [Candidatus Limnocylindrales bacterium]|nr:Ku protein [Candidatus Limnocylindrales bacterium]